MHNATLTFLLYLPITPDAFRNKFYSLGYKMMELKDDEWINRLAKVDHAFQPVVNIHTGNTFGFEALLRCHSAAGFSSIDQLFDTA